MLDAGFLHLCDLSELCGVSVSNLFENLGGKSRR
jgi:hypothetical protein